MNAFDLVEKTVKAEQRECRAKIEDLEKQVRQANAYADMYANAWERELAAYNGLIRNKRHHIDAMVLTTRDLVEKLKAAESRVRELEAVAKEGGAMGDDLKGGEV